MADDHTTSPEQGWNAYDQRNGGKVACRGQWGDAVTVEHGEIRNVSSPKDTQ